MEEKQSEEKKDGKKEDQEKDMISLVDEDGNGIIDFHNKFI